jgi:integrase/recombinase XerD
MLKTWRRHLKSCPHRSVNYLRCKCPLWVMGTYEGRFIRRSLDTRSLEHAAFLIRKMELGQGEKVSIADACDRFITQGVANGLSSDTLQKHRLLKREMEAFFGGLWIPVRSGTQ